jgi:hypothetical protein
VCENRNTCWTNLLKYQLQCNSLVVERAAEKCRCNLWMDIGS